MIHKTMRSILSVLLAALLLVTSTPLTPAFAGEVGAVSLQSESGERGELKQVDGVYQISTAEQLKEFRDEVNSGKTDADAILTADINLNPNMEISEDGTVTNGSDLDQWTPIGNEDHLYTGTFDGDGHTIRGLYIKSSDNDYKGLFGYVGTRGTVQNLSVSGSVSGRMYVGGVVGLNSGTVENCYNTGNISGNISGGSPVGGVVGRNDGTVKNCYNTGKVSGNYVGGVVGLNNSGIVKNCHNIGEVSGNQVGGVVGDNGGTVENCYNTASVNGSIEAGGVVGVRPAWVTTRW